MFSLLPNDECSNQPQGSAHSGKSAGGVLSGRVVVAGQVPLNLLYFFISNIATLIITCLKGLL